jgi:hypothetical protein
MKITKSKLKQLIKEGIFEPESSDSEVGERLLDALDKLLKGINNLDTSMDYLSATMSGEDPLTIQYGQTALGRMRRPPPRSAAPTPPTPLKESEGNLSWESHIQEAITSLYDDGYKAEEIREMIDSTFGVVMKEVLDEKKEPPEKTLKKMEKSLTKTAKEKFPKDEERQNAYIYGTKRKTGWKPEREK